MKTLPPAFEYLRKIKQFVIYKLVASTKRVGKTDKYPLNPKTLAIASAFDPNNWMDVESAIKTLELLGSEYGVGFAFTADLNLWFLDIDNCLDEITGQWSQVATYLLNALPGAAVEVSQSGRGLHIIGSGSVPPHACKNVPLGLEFYTQDRFVALTGTSASGDAGRDMSYVLPWLVDNYFPKAADADLIGWSDEPVPEWNGPQNDDTLIERALRSKSASNVFGNRASFADLWHGDNDVLSKAFPSNTGDVYDRSSADASLAQHLAFWTGKNCERVLRLMQGSALAREKWDREKYMFDTISKACALGHDVLQDKVAELPVTTTIIDGEVMAAAPSLITGSTYASIEDQLRIFSGCVYIRDMHMVLIPGGHMLKPEQFRVAYGGFTFPMDNANERTSRNAWECFTESQAFRGPRADTSCFRPDLIPGQIIHIDGQSMVNTYWPVETPRMTGDIGPFMTHLNKILPNARDREIILAYMAACVQHKGIKFQWAPLVQGVEGNGKTLLTRCVAFAIGQRYSHWPKASQVAKAFNAWMQGRIFIGVEDVYVPFSQQDILEELKPMITGDRLEIEKKGVDQVTQSVCCNFILNANNKAALRKSRNDRRLGPFYTAQQEKSDLERDGMTGDYFPKLYNWLKNGGYEIVNEFLHTHVIPPEYNPANGHIAPLTSSTDEAIAYGLGRAEQEIVEAIEREESGFRGGWVSSMAIDSLLERINMAGKLPPNKRRDLMVNLGYDWHPNLVNGRVNNPVLPDSGKTRLFVHKFNAALLALPDPATIAKQYSIAQQVG